MEQFFDIFNMDLAFYNDTPSYAKAELSAGKLQCFVNGTDKKLMRLLTIPKPVLPEDPLAGQSFMSSSGGSRRGIHILSREFHERIFDHLEQYEDVFCFSITSRYMWTVRVRTLSRLYAPWIFRKRGAWAGCRLIIAGTYAEPSGLVLTEDERDFVDEFYDDDDDDGGSLQMALSKGASHVPIRDEDEEDWDFKLRIRERMFSTAVPKWMEEFLPWTQSFKLRVRKRNGPMVLRNLTKKEYVRDDGLSLSPEYTFKRDPMTLGCALMSRIVWSSNPSVHMQMSDEFAGKFIRGVWAGCLFDIVELGELDEKSDDWKDVTGEVKEDLCYLVSQDPSYWKAKGS